MTATFVIQLEWLYLIAAVLNCQKEESNFHFAEVLTRQFLSVLGLTQKWVQKGRWVAIKNLTDSLHEICRKLSYYLLFPVVISGSLDRMSMKSQEGVTGSAPS